MKQVTVIGFNMHLVPKKELEDIIAMGNEVLIQAYNLQFTVLDGFAREILPVVTCVENDAPFVKRIVKNAMTRWPWLVRGVAELCDQWTDAIRWAVLKDEIYDAVSEVKKIEEKLSKHETRYESVD